MQIKFVVTVKQGRIMWGDGLRDLWNKNLLNMGDGQYELLIGRPQKPKSDKQRAYYWSVICKVPADETGMDPLEVHAYNKQMFLPYDKDSTEKLTTTQEEEYHTKIRAHWNTEFNILIPLPNEVVV